MPRPLPSPTSISSTPLLDTTGGTVSAPQTLSEQYTLDAEREAFVSLCGERKTQERIAHTLKTGKPLRN